MNIVAVHANPRKEGTSYSLLQAFSKGCKKAKHRLQVIDLYPEDFDPRLPAEDMTRGHKIKPAIKKYQDLIAKADCLVLIYPIWWYRMPSILEGWFDRVMNVGFAFRYRKLTKTFGLPVGLLSVKKAVVIDTYGSPWWAVKFMLFNLPFLRVKYGLLRYCGIKKTIHYPCYSAPYVDKKKKEQWAKAVERIAEKLL